MWREEEEEKKEQEGEGRREEGVERDRGRENMNVIRENE